MPDQAAAPARSDPLQLPYRAPVAVAWLLLDRPRSAPSPNPTEQAPCHSYARIRTRLNCLGETVKSNTPTKLRDMNSLNGTISQTHGLEVGPLLQSSSTVCSQAGFSKLKAWILCLFLPFCAVSP